MKDRGLYGQHLKRPSSPTAIKIIYAEKSGPDLITKCKKLLKRTKYTASTGLLL